MWKEDVNGMYKLIVIMLALAICGCKQPSQIGEDYQPVYDFHETIVRLGYIGCDDTLGMKFKK